MSDRAAESWEPKIEMGRLYEGIRGALSSANRKTVKQFIDVNEWGEALDLILFLVEREGMRISPRDRERIDRLAAHIGFDLDQCRRGWGRK